jgi:hypothetical protein
VTISPDNLASYGLVVQYGFTEVGEQWDEEDGLEIIYEAAAVSRSQPDTSEGSRSAGPT